MLTAARTGLEESYGVEGASLRLLGRVPHQFSHISQVYVVLSAPVDEGEEPRSPAQAQQWATSQSIASLAVPTGMKKVRANLESNNYII